MRLILVNILWVFGIVIAQGQDLHYSYYQYAPLTVNPALAGSFSGSYRINGIYSDKQASLSGRPYRTFTVSADAPLFKGIRKQDWIGVGIEVTQFGLLNGSGSVTEPIGPNNPDGGLYAQAFQNWTTFKLGGAYHLSLDKKQTRIFTLGVQYGNNARKFLKLDQGDGRVLPVTGFTDLDIETFNEKIKAGTGAVDRLNTAFSDLVFGILYNQRNKNSDLKLGFSIEGLSRPRTDIQKQGDERKYLGLNIHGAYDMTINKKVHVVPGVYYYSLGPANGLNINTHVNYLFNEEKGTTLTGGLGIRNLRAISLYVGATINKVNVGFAYDLDISSAVAGSGSVGGYELVASYLGFIYKKPKLKPEIFCPRL